jgi:hypothetical protein
MQQSLLARLSVLIRRPRNKLQIARYPSRTQNLANCSTRTHQAVADFRESGAGDEPTIQAEINRYIAWPAQGLSYQIGKLKILELRQRAQQQLGQRFGIRAFHDEVLGGRSLPLDILSARVDGWVRSQIPHAVSR